MAERVPDAPASVHLCDWPRVDAAVIDEQLSAATGLAMRLARLGRSARAAANLRVRQPLAELVVDLDSEQEQARLPVIRAQLLDELNVKQVRLAAEVGGLTAATVKPNFRALGPRFGRRMKEVTAAIAAADPASLAAQAASADPVQVGEFELRAADLVVETAPREAYAIATEPGCQVGVLKELTPELRAEGMVREAVHLINNLRRKSGFAITDRIRLFVKVHGEPDVEETYSSLIGFADKARHHQGSLGDRVTLFANLYNKPNPLKVALLANDKQFRDEVLATEVSYDAELPRGAPATECVIDEHRVTIAVQLSRG